MSIAAHAAARLTPPGRSIGIDTARGLALFGMMATHLVTFIGPDLEVSIATVFAGKASALFAVLAGFSLILSTAGILSDPSAGAWRRAAAGVFVRGGLIAVIGLVLGSISTALAVILVNYGVMFILATFLLRARTWLLGVLAGLWFIVTPVVSMAVRRSADLEQSFEVPGLMSVLEPGALLQALLLTGYYPVLQWLGYVILGMFLARLDYSRAAVKASTLLLGTGAAVLASSISSLLMTWRGRDVLEALVGPVQPYAPGSLDAMLTTGAHGVTPTDSWWWLVTTAPHSGTPFDLVHTAGIAVAVIGAAMLVADALGPRRILLAPVSAPGSMPLTVYSCHVVLTEITRAADLTGWPSFWLHVVVFSAAALIWKLAVSARGPLEWLVALAVRTTTSAAGQFPRDH